MGRLARDVVVLVLASVIAIPVGNALSSGVLPAPTASFLAFAVPTLGTLLLFGFCWNRGWAALAHSRPMALIAAPLYVGFFATLFAALALAALCATLLYTTGRTCVADLTNTDVHALLTVAAATPTLAIGLRTLGQSISGGTRGYDADGAAVIISVLLALTCVGISAWSLASFALPRLIGTFPPAIACGA